MHLFQPIATRIQRYPRWQLVWRSLLAAPFVLSLVLTLVLGPATITSVHGSYLGLLAFSLVAAVLLFAGGERTLIAVGLVTFLAFPLLAGLGFNFAPGWAWPLVVVIFYGSMVASFAAMVTGLVAIVRALVGRHPRAAAIAAESLALLALVTVAGAAAAPAHTVSASMSAAGVSRGAAVQAKAVNMGPLINTAQREAEPSFTADGRTMYYNCHDSDICVTRLVGAWEQGQWTPPKVVGPPISTAYTEVEPWINATGDRLYFNSVRPFARGDRLPGLSLYVEAVGLLSVAITDQWGISLFNGLGQDDIWVSQLINGVWSEPRNLTDVPGEPPVNTAFMDHCLAFSADGNEAFWTSTRPGGFGGNDIWTSQRVHGAWTAPTNLGSNVNGPYSEHHAMPSPDGRSLYVTSNRPGGYGGEDTYVTRRSADGAWGPLVNLGPPINGPGNDRCPTWTPDGRIVLFDSDRAGGFGSKDLWWTYFTDTR